MLKISNLYILILLTLLINCSSSQKEEIALKDIPEADQLNEKNVADDSFDLANYGIEIEKGNNSYESVMQKIKNDKLKLLKAYSESSITIDSGSGYFAQSLVNMIIPYWYGTIWDFNGYTNSPNEGYIACGYFVSTTLKHMGLNVNRYKLAQQSALNAIRTLAMNDTFYNLKTEDASTAIEVIKSNLKEGLFVVGLSCHVGFILYQAGEVFFIHSDYNYPAEVKIEIAIESESFNQSGCYYLCPVSANNSLMKKWLNGEAISIISN